MKGVITLYEDDEILVLCKPAGLAVQGGERVGASLDALLAAEYSPAPLLVHRLDKETSGVIVTARTREAAARYGKLFRDNAARKRYLALCAGTPPESGEMDEELELKGRKKSALTRYRRLACGRLPLAGEAALADGGQPTCSLLELELGTGRTHQIRRHLAGAGCPILGDDKYGDFALNKKLRKAGLRRMLLHARSISLPGKAAGSQGSGGKSAGGKPLVITAPLPDYFTAFLEASRIDIHSAL
jgi:23S rRNA pseudouridine955/2504/2580 synthase